MQERAFMTRYATRYVYHKLRPERESAARSGPITITISIRQPQTTALYGIGVGARLGCILHCIGHWSWDISTKLSLLPSMLKTLGVPSNEDRIKWKKGIQSPLRLEQSDERADRSTTAERAVVACYCYPTASAQCQQPAHGVDTLAAADRHPDNPSSSDGVQRRVCAPNEIFGGRVDRGHVCGKVVSDRCSQFCV